MLAITACAAVLFGFASVARAADTVYWGNFGDNAIKGAPLAGGGAVGTLYGSAQGVSGPVAVAIDPSAGRIYWTNFSADTIQAAPLGGGVIVDTLYGSVDGVIAPTGLAIDPSAGRIYWTNAGGDNTIRAAPLAGGGTVDTLYGSAQGVSSPEGVAIDPAAGRIYWANNPVGDDQIMGAPLAGAGTVDTLYDGPGEGVASPSGMALDSSAGRIYWANFASDTIRGAPAAGGGTVDTLYGSAQGVHTPEGVAIDPAAGRIYWANNVGDTIRGAPLAGGGTVDTLYGSAQGVSMPEFLAALRAPVGAGPPAVSGGPQVGQQLACTQGNWAPDLLGAFLYRAPAAFAYRWTLNGSDIPGATSATHTPTVAGAYACRVTASNQAGSTVQTSGTITVSGPPRPRARITGTPGKKKHKRRHKARLYTFKFADDLPGVTFLCQLDQRPFEPCTSPKTYRNLKPGKHTFTVKSVDAGGVESEPQTVSFRARPKRPK